MESEGTASLQRMPVKLNNVRSIRAADMRYQGQEHTVTVPLPPDLTARDARDNIKQAFDDAYAQQFSHTASDQEVEFVTLRIAAVGVLHPPELTRLPEGGKTAVPDASRGSRKVLYAGASERVDAQVYDRRHLLAGNVIQGPALIDEHASTTVIGPHDELAVNRYGHLVIEVRT
jgi:N-methylhydantoinase A